jgi:hypothetical protein
MNKIRHVFLNLQFNWVFCIFSLVFTTAIYLYISRIVMTEEVKYLTD